MYLVRYEKNLEDKHGDKVDALARPYPFIPLVLIKIDADREDKESLLAHEKEHWKQHMMTLFIHPLLYNYFKRYRLWAEVCAHKKQLEYADNIKEQTIKYAVSIANDYGLDVTPMEVFRMLVDA